MFELLSAPIVGTLSDQRNVPTTAYVLGGTQKVGASAHVLLLPVEMTVVETDI